MGSRFGGFSPSAFESQNPGYLPMNGRDSDKHFLFSLDFKRHFKHRGDRFKSIYSKETHGPCFGGNEGDLVIKNRCNMTKDNYSRLSG